MSSVGNQKQTRKELEGQFSDERTDGDATVMGYEDPSGLPRSVPGDEESAALKTPPFLTEAAVLIPTTATPTAAYAFTPIIDVAKRRLIEIYIEFTANVGNSSQLSLVPRIRRSQDPNELYPVGAIDVAPTTVTLLAPFALVGAAAASRLIFISEFRSTVILTGAVYRNTLGFDVSAFASFQLGYAELSGNAGTLRLDYAFSD